MATFRLACSLTGLLLAALACAVRPAGSLSPAPARGPARVAYASVRSSKYGIKPFPEPPAWERTIGAMTAYFPGSAPCVIGFGVDVEWNRTADYPETGMAVDDATARDWEAKVKAHNPAYRLFLKHWNEKWMPPTYRGDIVFVDDSQIFPDMEAMVQEFSGKWAPAFFPNLVVFQIGYNSDKPWWSKLPDPPKTIGDAIRKRVRQDMAIIWVDFSLREVLPADGRKQP